MLEINILTIAQLPSHFLNGYAFSPQDTIPDVGSPWVIVPTNKLLEIDIRGIFIFQDILPFPYGIKNPPYLFCLQHLIELLKVPDAKTPLLFGSTDSLPSH